MNSRKILIGLILAILGIFGLASLLTMDIPIPIEIEEILKENFTPFQIKLMILINPAILLVIAVVVGTLLFQKVGLRVPIFEKLVGLTKEHPKYSEITIYGIVGGIATGLILTFVIFLFKSLTPAEFEQLGQTLQPTLAARFIYGGFTEEILLRFGLMTLAVWLSSLLYKGTKSSTYWIGLVIASLLFAIGHFPAAFQSVDNPSLTLLSYILIGNSIGGIVFGWLYWKKGLESAFIAHIFTHVALVVVERITL